MAASDSPLGDLYDRVVDRVGNAPLVGSEPAVPVFRKDDSSPDELVRKATAQGASGVAIFVSQPRLAPKGSLRKAYNGSFTVEIVEDATLNRGPGGTGKTGPEIEDSIVRHLTVWSHGLPISGITVRGWEMPDSGGGSIRVITFGFSCLATSY